MRKNVISIALLSLAMFAATAEAMPVVDGGGPKANIEELIERKGQYYSLYTGAFELE